MAELSSFNSRRVYALLYGLEEASHTTQGSHWIQSVQLK